MKKLLMISLTVFLMACAQTKKSNKVETSGFLGDYSQLTESEDDDQAVLRYIKQDLDIGKYKNAIVDPVSIWAVEGTSFANVEPEARQMLADNFYLYLRRDVGEVLNLVRTPQPNTLRVQVALTEAEESSPVLDTVSSVIPVGAAINVLKDIAGSDPAFTGGATAEIKITDAFTGELLAAAVDRRVGGKALDASLSDWKDVDSVMQYWSKMLAYRICHNSYRFNCEKPS